MRRTLPVTVALLLLFAGPAAAQTENVTDGLDETAQEGQDLLQPILDGVGEAVGGAADAVEDAGKGLADGASAFGRFLGRAAAAVGQAASAAFQGLSSLSALAALGLGGVAIAVSQGVGQALVATGAGNAWLWATTGSGLASAGAALGSGLAFLASTYAGFVGSLRPDAMPPIAFGGVVAAGAATSTGVGGWAGWQVLRKWGFLGAPAIAGFSRISDDDLLDHPVRGSLFTIIQENPGIHASQLAREAGVGWGTVSHHLDKLQRASLVTTRKVNNQKCFFENGGKVSRQDMEVASALKGDTAARMADFVHHHPMTSQKDVAEALGISPALASFHAKKLVNLGVLERIRHGKQVMLTTSQSMRRLLAADRDLLTAAHTHSQEHLDLVA